MNYQKQTNNLVSQATIHVSRNTRVIRGKKSALVRGKKSVLVCVHGIFTSVERSLQNHLFMQNEPNFRKSQMNASYYITMDYEKRTLGERGKNEPKTNPNEPNLSWRSLWRSRIKANFRAKKMLLRLTIPYYNGRNTIIYLRCGPTPLFQIGHRTLC